MLCFALQAETEPGCGEATHVWTEPGNEHAGDLLTVVCTLHSLRLKDRGESVRMIRRGGR